MPNHNTFISASAGTGKTYRLATHVIDLIHKGEPPQGIIALTFSRLAAAEIFCRIATLLCQAASDDLQAKAFGMDSARAEELLHKLIDAQHLSQIGTLDSFASRILACFPLESRRAVRTSVMAGNEEADRALYQSLGHALSDRTLSEEDQHQFLQALQLAFMREQRKTVLLPLQAFLKSWQKMVFAINDRTPDEAIRRNAWSYFKRWIQYDPVAEFIRIKSEFDALAQQHQRTPEQQAELETLEADFARASQLADKAELTKLKQKHTKALNQYPDWEGVLRWIEQGNYSFSEKNLPQTLKYAIGYAEKSPDARRKCRYHYSEEECTFILKLKQHLGRAHLAKKAMQTIGLYHVVTRVEAILERTVRQEGYLTFDDISRSARDLLRQHHDDVGYRLDAQLQHWALDEFQDTSWVQWQSIEPFVDEALSDENRSVFVVGDVKQAIYGWRGGDSRIFETLSARGLFEREALNSSYRYTKEITEFLNCLYDPDTLRTLDPEGKVPTVWAHWSAIWGEHHSYASKAGYYHACLANNQGNQIEDYLQPILERLKEVTPWYRSLTTAILIRDNDDGKAIADKLRHEGIPASFEGDEVLCTSPVVGALLNLLWSIEHPGDALADLQLRETPLSQLKISPRIAAQDIARQGLSTTLSGWVNKLSLTDDYSLSRLKDLVNFAANWEATARPKDTLSDFVRSARAYTIKRSGDASTVRVLTIHKSKGLGFDLVFYVLREARGFTSKKDENSAPLLNDTVPWVILQPQKDALNIDEEIAATALAKQEQATFENICCQYVAMTRAKRELMLVLSPPPKSKAKVARLSDLVAGLPCGTAIGDPSWYTESPVAPRQKVATSEPIPPLTLPARRTKRPSAGHAENFTGDHLFVESTAAELGTRIHVAFERILWLDPNRFDYTDLPETANRPTPLRTALLCPKVAPIEVWREQPFEIMTPDDTWISGVIDRAHLWSDHAEVLDYKSNQIREEESPETFRQRMLETYSEQLQTYRLAVAQLTNLPPEKIALKLLLTATGDVVEVP